MTETTDERIARIHQQIHQQISQQISARMEEVIRECVEHCARIADEEEAYAEPGHGKATASRIGARIRGLLTNAEVR